MVFNMGQILEDLDRKFFVNFKEISLPKSFKCASTMRDRKEANTDQRRSRDGYAKLIQEISDSVTT